jgi:Cytosol aminopeptidase family, catalytic domain
MKLMRGDMGVSQPFDSLSWYSTLIVLILPRWGCHGRVVRAGHCSAQDPVDSPIASERMLLTYYGQHQPCCHHTPLREHARAKRDKARRYVRCLPAFVGCDFNRFLNDLMDSIYAMNGKSVEVDNTDAEGRLILSGQHHLNLFLWLFN